MFEKPNRLRGLSFALLLLSAAVAQGQVNNTFVYSVEVVCGDATTNLPFMVDEGSVKNVAQTFVNLHNPSQFEIKFTFRAIQPATGTSPGAVFDPMTEILSGFSARSFDCSEFITLQQPAAQALPVTEGFLVIESPIRIQVAATYHSQSLAAALVDDGSTDLYWIGSKNVFGEGELPETESVPITRVSDQDVEMAQEQSGSIDMPIVSMAKQTKIQAAGMGLGLGLGSSRGTGLGLGAGSSIDVEYIEPIVVSDNQEP